MIELKKHNNLELASAKDIHLNLDVKSQFDTWIKTGIKNAWLKEDLDFYTYKYKSTGGRPFTDYLLTENSALAIIVMSRVKKAKYVRDELLKAFQQQKDLDLLNHEQIIGLSALIGFFKYIDNQKEVETKHKNEYVKDNFSKYSFAEFHQYRNKALEIEPNIIDQKIKEYCVINSRALPNLNNKHAKIQFLDMYKNLRNAVWDFMEIKGQINSLKLANLAEKMAKAGNLELFHKNEDNLFQNKENIKRLM